MFEVLTDFNFWLGVIVGAGSFAYYKYSKRASNKIGYVAVKRIAEELLNTYRNEDIAGIEEFKESYIKRDDKDYIFEKRAETSPFQLWAAIVLYVTHRYADYNFNSYDSEEWRDIVAKTFGNKSLAFSKYKAVDEILNRSTMYYLTPSGSLKTDKTKRTTFIGDYGDEALYNMIMLIIKSSFENNISFEEYSEVEDPSDGYDWGSYVLADIQLKDDNNVEGIKNLEKAALSGLPEAQSLLGLIYSCGERVRKNDGLAFKWFLKSAENEDPMGMFFTGRAYYDGTKCEKDLKKAVYWLQKSVDKGYSQAQDFLGVMYLNGKGVEKDSAKGYELISKAADQNDAHSQYILAVMYARGEDINFDKEKALYWLDKAVNNNAAYEKYRSEVIGFINEHED